MLKLTLKSLSLALLLLASNGCSSKSVSPYGECPKFYVQEPKEPVVKTQIKSFKLITFVRDTELDRGTAVCRFNNNDYDHVMKDATIINTLDLGMTFEHGYYNYGIIVNENTRSKKFFGDMNATKE